MTRLTFPDFEQYADAMPTLRGRVRIVGKAERGWAVETKAVAGLVLVRGESGAPGIYEGCGSDGMFSMYMPEPKAQTRVNGQLVGEGYAALLPPRADLRVRSRAPGCFLGLDIPASVLAQHLLKQENWPAAALLSQASIVRLPPGFVKTVEAAFCCSGEAGAKEARTLVARSIQASLMTGIASAFTGMPQRVPRRLASSERLVSLAAGLIERRLLSGDAITRLPDTLCVSQRSLNRAFAETFCMSPQRYANVARLHAVRSALRSAKRGATVTEIATRYGIGDTGRMAGAYLELFGIHPSEQLKIAKEHRE